jgi:surface protein
VSNVENMGSMFYKASSFNQPLNAWDVSIGPAMYSMFEFATSFNQPLSNWDVRNVFNMDNMFQGAEVFNQDLSGWDVSNVVYHEYFARWSGLTAENMPPF